jgi:hypothetical protein
MVEELQDEFKNTCSKSGLERNFSWRLGELKPQEPECKEKNLSLDGRS